MLISVNQLRKITPINAPLYNLPLNRPILLKCLAERFCAVITMKVQLFILLTVLLVSFLTVSQHVKSDPATAPVTEQTYTDVLLLDKDERVDAELLANHTSLSQTLYSTPSDCCYPTKAPHFKLKASHLPRAPPSLLI